MSLQTLIAKTMMKLPGSILVKLSGGKPITIEGRILEPQLQAMAWNGRNAPPFSSLDPVTAQAAAIEQLALIADTPEPDVALEDFAIAGPDGNQIPVRLYRPPVQDPSAPMMVFYHQGGGVIGDLETSHVFCSMIAKAASCPLISVDYRLAPQHKYPAGLEDCITAYEWALRNAEDYGAPGGRAAIGGDSMGGYFSAIISQEMKRAHKPVPALQLLVYPALDTEKFYPSKTTFGETFSLSSDTMDWFMDQYVPEGMDRKQVRLAPGREGDLSGLPPAIIATAGFDPLVDEGDEYAQRLEAAGVDVIHKRYDSLAHAFTAFTAMSPGSKAACLEIAGFVREMYSRLDD